MHDRKKFDVAIIGAGPGGALLAYFLARSSLNVLIMEKKGLPRYKPCGGGLTQKALNIIPFDISNVIEETALTTEIRVNGQTVFDETFNEPVISMVMRDRFDHFITEKAVAAGAILKEGISFKSVAGQPGNLEVGTSGETFQTKLIAGADGVNSRTAKALGLKPSFKTMAALEGEIYPLAEGSFTPYKNSVCFDFGVIPKGYGWIFPKQDHLSAGVLTLSKNMTGLNNYFSSYLKSRSLDTVSDVRILKGHLIPYGPGKKSILADKRGLLVGDAAGYTDPVTGEGIYYAAKTATLASSIIQKALKNGYDHMDSYNDLVKKEFQKETACALNFARLLYNFPKISYKLMQKKGASLGRYHIDIISGRKTYAELQKEMFNLKKTVSILWSLFSRKQ